MERRKLQQWKYSCLPPKMKSEQRTAWTAGAGWGWAQTSWGETES